MTVHGLTFRRACYASEIWRAYFREGLLSEFYGISWEKFMNIFICLFFVSFVFFFVWLGQNTKKCLNA